jgi:hypothetical protein
VIATSVWLLGAAVIHVTEMVGEGNYNPGNAGGGLLYGHYRPAVPHGLAGLLPLRGARTSRAVRRGKIRRATPVACSYRGRSMKTSLSMHATRCKSYRVK